MGKVGSPLKGHPSCLAILDLPKTVSKSSPNLPKIAIKFFAWSGGGFSRTRVDHEAADNCV